MGEKRCPDCAEAVLADARVCKHCGFRFEGTSSSTQVPVPQPDHPRGTLILVLGIVSFLSCGLLGPVAWVMGNRAIREVDASSPPARNRGAIQAGRVLGIVSSCILILVLLGTLALAVFVGDGGGGGGDDRPKNDCEIEADRLGVAVEEYHDRYGEYPGADADISEFSGNLAGLAYLEGDGGSERPKVLWDEPC